MERPEPFNFVDKVICSMIWHCGYYCYIECVPRCIAIEMTLVTSLNQSPMNHQLVYLLPIKDCTNHPKHQTSKTQNINFTIYSQLPISQTRKGLGKSVRLSEMSDLSIIQMNHDKACIMLNRRIHLLLLNK